MVAANPSTNTAFLEYTLHSSDSLPEVGSRRRVLDNHRVKVRCDGQARVSDTVHADALARRVTVEGDGTRIRSKVALGILRGHTALNGDTTRLDVLLDETDLFQGSTRRDADLCLHQIDAGDLSFGEMLRSHKIHFVHKISFLTSSVTVCST